MTQLHTSYIQCKMLFEVSNQAQMQSYVAVTDSDTLLLVTEELAGMVMLVGQKTYYRLDVSEFRSYVTKARQSGRLQEAISRNWTSNQEIDRLCR